MLGAPPWTVLGSLFGSLLSWFGCFFGDVSESWFEVGFLVFFNLKRGRVHGNDFMFNHYLLIPIDLQNDSSPFDNDSPRLRHHSFTKKYSGIPKLPNARRGIRKMSTR